MDSVFIKHIETILNKKVTQLISVSGGDISEAFKIETSTKSYFLKVNNTPNALSMFKAEAYGLQLINDTKSIKTPKVIAYYSYQNTSFLLLEFIESKSPSTEDFKKLGHQLAKLHKNTSENFGLNQNNFIGSLPQSNTQHNTWLDFYTSERLLPQLELAKQKNLLTNKECPNEENIKNQLQELFTNIKPALLHGDLWSGNYLISTSGEPYLIDPAVYYGHFEVDIAMSKLFGGFSNDFYEEYFSNFTINSGTKARIEIYQLYYLLVHLNLFGSSYYSSVSSILKKYF
ncbi:fructosamine kinase family protein [Flaviramulus sp. BrNp1-15]|uniref:fructosamine kinase family protein n=1 Tax=Flaviramulus sp. BrNp1-15 TaxID=2916754 RepID=UPI001EE826A2|nr:fructosamine kinase family protein [Flaviramulus sp. BrNp1-15]ULC58885.1 fructosamine kinase family protein [Flaviramulus sp. BrNp1-15]